MEYKTALQQRFLLALGEEKTDVKKLAKVKGVGMGYQGLKKIADGLTEDMSAAKCVTIAKLLNVRVEWLATGEGPMRPVLAIPEVTLVSAITDLSQFLTGLSHMSRMAIRPLLSGLATDPGAASQVARMIQAIVAMDPKTATEATELDEVEEWAGNDLRMHQVEGNTSPQELVNQSEMLDWASKKGEK